MKFPARLLLIALGTVLLAAAPARAMLPDEKLADMRLEARAEILSKGLRCVVCQNENIDDSAAPIARDMRLLLRERLLAGDSDDHAVAYLVARYGNYVLLKPPVQGDTLILWLAPFGVFVVAAWMLALALRRRSRADGVVPVETNDDAEWDEAGGPILASRRS
jgi:cytochrome c-type biogenesis protein CcmH